MTDDTKAALRVLADETRNLPPQQVGEAVAKALLLIANDDAASAAPADTTGTA